MNSLVIYCKFAGFIITLLVLVVVAVFCKDIPHAQVVLGCLTTIATMQGRDLYRSSTTVGDNGHKDQKEVKDVEKPV